MYDAIDSTWIVNRRTGAYVSVFLNEKSRFEEYCIDLKANYFLCLCLFMKTKTPR